jgi:hypothetical protein
MQNTVASDAHLAGIIQATTVLHLCSTTHGVKGHLNSSPLLGAKVVVGLWVDGKARNEVALARALLLTRRMLHQHSSPYSDEH